jgi:hypothetical protein
MGISTSNGTSYNSSTLNFHTSGFGTAGYGFDCPFTEEETLASGNSPGSYLILKGPTNAGCGNQNIQFTVNGTVGTVAPTNASQSSSTGLATPQQSAVMGFQPSIFDQSGVNNGGVARGRNDNALFGPYIPVNYANGPLNWYLSHANYNPFTSSYGAEGGQTFNVYAHTFIPVEQTTAPLVTALSAPSSPTAVVQATTGGSCGAAMYYMAIACANQSCSLHSPPSAEFSVTSTGSTNVYNTAWIPGTAHDYGYLLARGATSGSEVIITPAALANTAINGGTTGFRDACVASYNPGSAYNFNTPTTSTLTISTTGLIPAVGSVLTISLPAAVVSAGGPGAALNGLTMTVTSVTPGFTALIAGSFTGTLSSTIAATTSGTNLQFYPSATGYGPVSSTAGQWAQNTSIGPWTGQPQASGPVIGRQMTGGTAQTMGAWSVSGTAFTGTAPSLAALPIYGANLTFAGTSSTGLNAATLTVQQISGTTFSGTLSASVTAATGTGGTYTFTGNLASSLASLTIANIPSVAITGRIVAGITCDAASAAGTVTLHLIFFDSSYGTSAVQQTPTVVTTCTTIGSSSYGQFEQIINFYPGSKVGMYTTTSSSTIVDDVSVVFEQLTSN